MCFSLTVVNVSTESLERYFPFNLFLSAGNFCTTQTATDNNFDTFGVGTHGFLYSLFHGTTERDTLLQLLSNAATDENSIQFRLANFDDIHAHAAFFGFGL
jgi:hypothetical protein